MTHDAPVSLRNVISATAGESDSSLSSAEVCVAYSDIVNGSILGGRGEELRGRSVVICTSGQLSTALALLELDGVARRIVIFPNEPRLDHLPFVIAAANADAIVSDRTDLDADFSPIQHFIPDPRKIVPANYDRSLQQPTEWITLTSGTMGPPKLVVHSLSSSPAVLVLSKFSTQKIWP